MMFGITLLLLVAWLAGTGRDRSPTIHRYFLVILLGGGLLMAIQRDWWPLALWSLVSVNALRFPWPLLQITRLSTALVLYAIVQAFPAVEPVMLLEAIVGLAAIGVSLWAFHPGFRWNANHTDMLMVMGIAACAALSLLVHPAWILIAPTFFLPFWRRTTGQAWQWIGVTALVSFGVLISPLLPLVGGSLFAGVLGYAGWPHRLTTTGPDHGRFRIWAIMLRCWWHTTWPERIMGLGWNSWRSWTDSLSKLEQKHGTPAHQTEFLTHPHNEYLHILFEHGVLGLVLALGWIGSLLWRAWQIEPALCIPGVTLCAIAFTCYPWTLPYEVGVERRQYIEYVPFGCMGMVVVSMLLLRVLAR